MRSAVLYAPAGFTRQDVELADGEYWPAGHSKQLPLPARYVPAGQGTQAVALTLACDPDGQDVHVRAAPVEMVAGGHAEQLWLVAFKNVPAEHDTYPVPSAVLYAPEGLTRHDVALADGEY